jgi:hypothetical protein
MNSRTITIVALFISCYCSVATAIQENYKGIETEYFKLKAPSSIEQVRRNEITLMNNQKAYEYAYAEADKKPKTSVLLAITPEHIRVIKKDERRQALNTIASSLKDTVINPQCKSQVSDFTYAEIDNDDAIYFEILNKECKVKIEKYWILIKDEYVFTIYLARPEQGNEDVYLDLERAIKGIKFKM